MAETVARAKPSPRVAPGPRHAARGLTIVLAGRPGAGKGTQAALVASQLGLVHVSTGDLLRGTAARSPHLRRELEGVMAEGKLVPDGTILALLERELEEIGSASDILLDGFPRTVAQANALEVLRRVDLVVEIDVPARRIVERLRARGRTDDRLAAIEARLHVYEQETRPMLRAFGARGALRTVDGDRPPELVAADLVTTIARRQAAARAGPHRS